jgi:hypothetical protein
VGPVKVILGAAELELSLLLVVVVVVDWGVVTLLDV